MSISDSELARVGGDTNLHAFLPCAASWFVIDVRMLACEILTAMARVIWNSMASCRLLCPIFSLEMTQKDLNSDASRGCHLQDCR
jgi:hypothetical protein